MLRLMKIGKSWENVLGQNRVPAKCGKVGKQQGLFVQILLSISLSWRQKTLFGGKSESPSQI